MTPTTHDIWDIIVFSIAAILVIMNYVIEFMICRELNKLDTDEDLEEILPSDIDAFKTRGSEKLFLELV